MTYIYDDKAPEGRFLILSDVEQTITPTPMKVIEATERESYGGKKYPVLMLEDDDGNSYQIAAWKRDVIACIKQYGTDPMSWGDVRVQLARSGTRYELVPAEMRIIEEKVKA